jgi:prepilin-type N-terminal cleavage/methylation domain-containing protein
VNPRTHGSQTDGFTLIELLIVVALIGILASIAVPTFTRYVAQSKTTEPRLLLKTMAESAIGYYQVEHYDRSGRPVPEIMFPTASYGEMDASINVVPADVPPGTKYATKPEDWRVSPWAEMKFRVARPHYYQYRYRAINAPDFGDAFTCRAKGDVDADGIQSDFRIYGEANESGLLRITGLIIANPSNELE